MKDFNWQAKLESISEDERYLAYKKRLIQEGFHIDDRMDKVYRERELRNPELAQKHARNCNIWNWQGAPCTCSAQEYR